MTPIILYAVHQNDTERNSGTPAWYYTSATEANNVADGRGWYGSKAPVSQHSALLIDGKYWLLANVTPIEVDRGPNWEKEVKAKALAKLTETEKQLLGLT